MMSQTSACLKNPVFIWSRDRLTISLKRKSSFKASKMFACQLGFFSPSPQLFSVLTALPTLNFRTLVQFCQPQYYHWSSQPQIRVLCCEMRLNLQWTFICLEMWAEELSPGNLGPNLLKTCLENNEVSICYLISLLFCQKV